MTGLVGSRRRRLAQRIWSSIVNCKRPDQDVQISAHIAKFARGALCRRLKGGWVSRSRMVLLPFARSCGIP
jgi:hypothetical protein